MKEKGSRIETSTPITINNNQDQVIIYVLDQLY